MNAKTIQRRLAQALMLANPTSSVSIDGENYIHVGLFTIELGTDRLVIGPSGSKLTQDEITLLGDPDSILWLMVRYNSPKFASKVVAFLGQHSIELPENWLPEN
jgi:hypothetical protein